MKAKIRLRELGVKGLKWSDPATGEDLSWWTQWVASLEQLAKLEVLRCLFPDRPDLVNLQLLTFVDASEEAYAAVTYTRAEYTAGRVIVRLGKAATKLTPMKTLSIPKLELDAALLGARQLRFVHRSLTTPIQRRFIWTDSSTVRHWVRATASHYQVFMSHRIGELQTLTDLGEWCFVRGKINPADCATRSQLIDEALPALWLQGPDFLYQPEESWPPDLPWEPVQEEKRACKILHSSAAVSLMDWESINITSADVARFVRMDSEYRELILPCQAEVFAQDIARLKKDKPVKTTSSILSLNPFPDDAGLLRLGGRIGKARLPYDVKHPPLLLGRHPLTRKLLQAFHEKLQHAGTDFILIYIFGLYEAERW